LPGTGFGHNPFGSSSYGEWEWSRYIFWDLIPEDVRSPDVDYGGYLELYMDGIRGPFDRIRIKIKDLRDLRDPLNIRTQYDETTVIRLGDEITPTGPLEQQGIDGVVQSFGTFKSETASFNENDRGKLLEITRSTISTNNQTYTIAAVISPKSVVTEPLIALDTGPLHWEMRALGGEDPDIRTFRSAMDATEASTAPATSRLLLHRFCLAIRESASRSRAWSIRSTTASTRSVAS